MPEPGTPRAPKGAEAAPFGATLLEAEGVLLKDALKPLESKPLSAQELDTLCDWLNAHPDSAMAQDIKKKRFWCYGKPVGEEVPFVFESVGKFWRFSLRRGSGWYSSDRVVVRD